MDFFLRFLYIYLALFTIQSIYHCASPPPTFRLSAFSFRKAFHFQLCPNLVSASQVTRAPKNTEIKISNSVEFQFGMMVL